MWKIALAVAVVVVIIIALRSREGFCESPMNAWDWIMFREQIAYRRRRYDCEHSPPVAQLLWT